MPKRKGEIRDLFSVKPAKKSAAKKSKGKHKYEKKVKKSEIPITPLTYESLTEGLVLLGCVQEVRDYELVVSLPHRLYGTVSLARISSAYTALLTKVQEGEEEAGEEVHPLSALYQVGQYVVCRIVTVEKINDKHKVSLTLMPQEVNYGLRGGQLGAWQVLPCAVVSREDKGFVMDTGLPDVRGAFLKHADTTGTEIKGVGSVVRCVVTKVLHSEHGESVSLVLSAEARALSKATLNLTDTSNLFLLLPGTAINTTISKVRKDGLQVLLAEGDGVVSPLHLRRPFDELSGYQLAGRVRARVLYITPLTKVVHFTLQNEVCTLRPDTDPLQDVQVGARIEAEIYCTKHEGIFLKLSDGCRGFCSSNRLTHKDTPPKHISRDFAVGSVRSCRILKYVYMDRLFIVSLQKSDLEQQVVGYRELSVGQVLRATIKGFDANGAQVAVAQHVDGCVPSHHLTDVPMKNPKLKRSKGEVVWARVLKVNPERRHLLLTCKTLLLDPSSPVISDYLPELVGAPFIGYVVLIKPTGLVVSMYNNVKGFVPLSLVTSEAVENLNKLFKLGEVVKGKIIEVQPEKQQMKLSMLEGVTQPKEEEDQVKMRNRVVCVVKDIEDEVILVQLLENKSIEAEIPVYHLSDDVEKCREIQEKIQVGDEIHNAVVFRKEAAVVILSLKHSVWHWVTSTSKEVQDSPEYIPEETYPAVVFDVRSYGVIVHLPCGKYGTRALVHATKLSVASSYVDCALGVEVGQNLTVTYYEQDSQNRPVFHADIGSDLESISNSEIKLICCHEAGDQSSSVQRKILRRLEREGEDSECILGATEEADEENRREKRKALETAGNVRKKPRREKDYSGLSLGQAVQITIFEYNETGALVRLIGQPPNLMGYVPFFHLTNRPLDHPESKYSVGDQLNARVLELVPEIHRLMLTCRKKLMQSKLPIITSLTQKLVGKRFIGCIVKVCIAGFRVCLLGNVFGYIPNYLASIEPDENLKEKYSLGKIVKGRVAGVFPKKKQILLSLLNDKVLDHERVRKNCLKMRSMVVCVVKKIDNEVIKVDIKPHNFEAQIPVYHLSDDITSSRAIKKKLQVGDEIHNAVVFKKSHHQVVLSLKRSVWKWVKSVDKEVQGGMEYHKGHKYPGVVIKVRPHVLIVALPLKKYGTTICLQKSQLFRAQKIVGLPRAGFPVGQSIVVIYKGLNENDRMVFHADMRKYRKYSSRLEIKLRCINASSAAGGEKREVVRRVKGLASDEESILVEQTAKQGRKRQASGHEMATAEPKLKKAKKITKEDQKVEEVGASDSGVDETMDTEEQPRLSVGTGFVWQVPDSTAPHSDSDTDSEVESKKKMKKLTRAERTALAKEEEQRLHQLELARLEKDRQPQTANDYEELLQHQPNSSEIWIQYMSFHLESAEVDKARAVGRRALQVMNVQEEGERLNVWTVLLRLEVLYGAPEALKEVYQEALATNDQLKVHLAMAMVYADSDKLKEAEKVYFTLTKKHGNNLEVWVKAGVFFFRHHLLEEGRKYMARALLSLPKQDHVELTSRFGQLEFRYGEAERGRTMFESLLSNFPKRTDLWSVYVDLLTKHGDIEGARRVLDRMTGLKLRLKKMRFVFKKFLEFEKVHGSPQSVEAVKRRVEEFLASTLDQQ